MNSTKSPTTSRLVSIPCVGCQDPILVSFNIANEFSDYLYCDKCFTTKHELCETCGKDNCDGECCNCEFCIKRRLS